MITIPLTAGKVALIDDEDARLAKYAWYAKLSRGRWYAMRQAPHDGPGPRQRTVQLHREVMGALPGQMVDHRNGDGLDCRRSNLRFATPVENARNGRKPTHNTAGYKGIAQTSTGRRWMARIRFEGKVKHVGTYGTREEAARAYDDAARRLYGEFACVNFPQPGERPATAIGGPEQKARRSPLSSMRDRWKFQLSQLPPGEGRDRLRRCIEDVNLVIGEAALDILQMVESEPMAAAGGTRDA